MEAFGTPILLGGLVPSRIDDSLMIKRKYQRGAEREQHHRWVFGIYDRTRLVSIIQFMNNRDGTLSYHHTEARSSWNIDIQ